MKRVMLAAGLVLLAVILLTERPDIFPGTKDFTAFRKEKLGLPEKNETICLSISSEGKASPGEKEPGAANARELYFDLDNRHYVLSIPNPLPEYRLVKTMCTDIDKDGLAENYSLKNGVITVHTGSTKTWQSPDEWWVDDFIIGDANNDGISDLNLLVWKVGSFGPRRPFWITGEDISIKNHLFIFDLTGDNFKPVWQSSNLDRPNYGSVLYDINGDGKNELVVSEGEYTVSGKRRVSVWQWNGWGFSMVSTDGINEQN